LIGKNAKGSLENKYTTDMDKEKELAVEDLVPPCFKPSLSPGSDDRMIYTEKRLQAIPSLYQPNRYSRARTKQNFTTLYTTLKIT
jgi:hypothetical protein